MNQNIFINYSSSRVEYFAISCLRKTCHLIGYKDITESEAKIAINASDFKIVVKKLQKHVHLKHGGNYGPLEEKVQNKLNFNIAVCEALNKTTQEKKELVDSFIKKNDTCVQNKRRLNYEQQFIVDAFRDFEYINANLGYFLRNADMLYSLLASKLKRVIDNDNELEKALQCLAELFEKYFQRIKKLILEEKNK